MARDTRQEELYRQRGAQRKALLQSRFFSEADDFFVDLTWPDLQATGRLSLAGVFPLFLGFATEKQAACVATRLERDFLRPGGWVTTLDHSGQQWDAPNGWAPLQWMVWLGLQRYGFHDLAREGARRWVDNNLETYHATGLLLEKYDVEQGERTAGGGEYPVQAGFGWTNGVLLQLMDALEID